MSHGQAQQASDAHANDLKDTIRLGVEEANDLRAQLATVVPRQQLRDAEGRIKVCLLHMACCASPIRDVHDFATTGTFTLLALCA